jgi:putative colanic acid biosynthesis glycosyltransferase WcaI
MRIAFVNRYFHPDLTGAAQMLTQLAEDLDARGQEVTVITSRTAYVTEVIRLPKRSMHKGIHVIRVPTTNLGSDRAWTRLIDYASFYLAALWVALRLRAPDALVVLSDPPLLSVLAVIVGTLKRVRTYCWLQDVYPEIAIRAGVLPEGAIARWLRIVAQWSLRKITNVIVLGRCMEKHLINSGLSADNMTQIPNWADGAQIESVNESDNEFLNRHGLKGRFIAMYSGNLGTVHEFTTILGMIRQTQSHSDVCFCFVGDGPQKRCLIETVRREGWQHVLFLPYETKERLRFSLSAADIHLVSLRGEMAGLSVPSKLYGIMAAGRPVIFIGPKESESAMVIREAECGHVISPGDVDGGVSALMTYYRHRDEIGRQGQAARQYFERHYERATATQSFLQVLTAHW